MCCKRIGLSELESRCPVVVADFAGGDPTLGPGAMGLGEAELTSRGETKSGLQGPWHR